MVVNPDGTSNYDAVANSSLAGNLKGKLFLGHGDFDENVHPAATQQLAAALVGAGKTFNMLITPNDDHSTFSRSPYVIRQKMQFLLRHLFPE
ncbi:alpha/beta hydrolase family protein [Mesorhizobium sp. A623]